MRTTLWVGVLFLVACKGGMGDDYDVTPPGGSGGTGGSNPGSGDGSDAGGSDSGAGTTIPARACLLTDARDLKSCSATGVAALNLKVTLGTGTPLTITDDAGNFTIVQPTGTALIWKVEGTTVVTSYMLLDQEATQIPVITTTKFTDMKAMAPTAVDIDGLGSIIAQLKSGGMGVQGATATMPPASYRLYDGASETTWQLGATGPDGSIWLAGVPAATSASLTTATPTHTRSGLPVHVGAITFTTIIL